MVQPQARGAGQFGHLENQRVRRRNTADKRTAVQRSNRAPLSWFIRTRLMRWRRQPLKVARHTAARDIQWHVLRNWAEGLARTGRRRRGELQRLSRTVRSFDRQSGRCNAKQSMALIQGTLPYSPSLPPKFQRATDP